MKKQYEVPQMTMIVLQTADLLLASAEGLTEDTGVNLNGSALVFRKDGSVNVWG